MAEEIYKAYMEGKSSTGKEKREFAQIERKIANLVKAMAAGADFEEVHEELARLRVRKAELDELLSASLDVKVTKEAIADKLKKDAQHLQTGDIEHLIKSYVTKIYAHNDEIIITGGVNLNGCGGRI